MYGTDYESASTDLAGWFRANKAKPAFTNRRFRKIDSIGAYKEDDPTAPGGRRFDLRNPHTNKIIPLRANRGWSFDQNEFNRLVAEGRITFITETSVMVRRYLHETDKLTPSSVFYQPARSASERLSSLMGASIFEFPKDETTIRKFIQMASREVPDAIVVDFFAGSGTTAQAVMELNAEDGGSRQCICVQFPEALDESSEAYRAGYRTIADITRARIEKVIAKLKEDSGLWSAPLRGALDTESEGVAKSEGDIENLFPDRIQSGGNRRTPKGGDLACAHFTLAPSNFKVWRGDVADADALREQMDLFQQAEKSGDRTRPVDAQTAMLAELLLKYGLGVLGVDAISKPVSVAGVTVHRVLMPDDRPMWLCFEPYSEALKDEIAKARPAQVVLLNSCFTGDKADELLSNLQLELAGLEIGLTVI